MRGLAFSFRETGGSAAEAWAETAKAARGSVREGEGGESLSSEDRAGVA